MDDLLHKFYAGEATPEEEAQLLRSVDSLPAGPDRDLLQALAAMQRRAAISRLIDSVETRPASSQRPDGNVAAETGQAPSLQRTRWPYWMGALAMAACILLLLLPREAAPVEMAESKEAQELRHPCLSKEDRHPACPTPSHVAGAGKMPANLAQAGSLSSQSDPIPCVETRPASSPYPDSNVAAETGLAPSLHEPDLLYAEALPEPEPSDDELIILSTPSLIAREYSTTLIADATPATSNSSLTTHHSPLTISLFGQTLGDPDADPFAQRSLFAN